jgi:hypothetical protein
LFIADEEKDILGEFELNFTGLLGPFLSNGYRVLGKFEEFLSIFREATSILQGSNQVPNPEHGDFVFLGHFREVNI